MVCERRKPDLERALAKQRKEDYNYQECVLIQQARSRDGSRHIRRFVGKALHVRRKRLRQDGDTEKKEDDDDQNTGNAA